MALFYAEINRYKRMGKTVLYSILLTLFSLGLEAQPAKPDKPEYLQSTYEVAENFFVNLKYQPDYDKNIPAVKNNIASFYSQFQKLFSDSSRVHVRLLILPTEDFHRLTGAPEWTNALFYDGQIFLPMQNKTENLEESLRPLRHELSHALIKSLTSGKCPGWLDEGIAQWAEGDEIDGLRGALAYWYDEHSKLVDYRLLQGGFTGLNNSQVAPAYAQSLMASKMLFKTYGTDQIKKYFNFLKAGKKNSFELAFAVKEEDFWSLLKELLKKEKIIDQQS